MEGYNHCMIYEFLRRLRSGALIKNILQADVSSEELREFQAFTGLEIAAVWALYLCARI